MFENYSFDDFSNDLELIVKNAPNNEKLVKAGVFYFNQLIKRKGFISEELIQEIKNGNRDNTLYFSKKHGFVIQLFVWEGNCSTPIHDHETWGIMGVYRNRLMVTEYSKVPLNNNQYDVNVLREYLLRENGDISYFIYPDEDVHMIKNPTEKLSVSIHIYGKRIDEYNTYDLENGQIIRNIV